LLIQRSKRDTGWGALAESAAADGSASRPYLPAHGNNVSDELPVELKVVVATRECARQDGAILAGRFDLAVMVLQPVPAAARACAPRATCLVTFSVA